ncbi:MAG: AAA family ATPase, partial [Thermodesulfovibrionales bacterium]|nr:AAA family ATPase [Thermodesulfovibrionales bacterium]
MKLKKLPIGISTLKEIVSEGYVYVDKTHITLNLIQNGKYYFLSRPRRFGKSLFLDTLRTIFEGDKECFKGLYIYDRHDFKKYPVIHISFGSNAARDKAGLHKEFYEILDYNQRQLKITCPKELSSKGCFKRLIEEAYNKYGEKAAILIDEYDKPILDNIEKPERAAEIRDELRDFYAVIKDRDRYIKFVFITGVSKFSKVSLFSGLNNLFDITLNPRYATICGYTQRDVETVFAEHLKGQDFDKIRHWYNGYKWLGEAVYNPFDILLFISNEYNFRNYWFSTGTPTFLLKLIEANNYYLPNLEKVTKDDELLDSFDVNNIELETLMWQTGYLTIDEVIEIEEERRYRLCLLYTSDAAD